MSASSPVVRVVGSPGPGGVCCNTIC